MLPRLLFLAAAAVGVVGVQATQCGWGSFDMSSYAEKDITYNDGQYLYSMRACGILSAGSPCLVHDAEAAVCQTQVSTESGASYVTGINVADPIWGYLDPNDDSAGIGYSLQGETECWSTQGIALPYNTNVNFACAIKAGQPTAVMELRTCTMNFTIPTPLACSGTPPPPPPSTCKWGAYDFRSLAGSVLSGSDGGHQYIYSLAVCGTLPESTGQCPGGSACQVQINSQSMDAYDIGTWINKPDWQYIDPSVPKRGVMYSMIGAKSCWSQGASAAYSANINFECADQQGALNITFNPYNTCTQNWTLPTPLACMPSESFETKLPELLALF